MGVQSMDNTPTPRCITCRHADLSDDEFALCRRYPPRPSLGIFHTEGVFPVVCPVSGWCGEHSPRPEQTQATDPKQAPKTATRRSKARAA